MTEGPRALMEDVLRVYTPDNMPSFLLSLASGLQMGHMEFIRSISGGQFPIFLLFSKGKGTGKSGAARVSLIIILTYLHSTFIHSYIVTT